MIDREPPQQEVQPLNLNVIRQSNPMLFSPLKYTAALLCFCFPSGVKPCLELGEYLMAANRLGYLLMRRFNNLKKLSSFPLGLHFHHQQQADIFVIDAPLLPIIVKFIKAS